MTKVQAIIALMQELGGSASWSQIYENIERFYPAAKTSREWKAGLRGVLYREMRNRRHFVQIGPATFALK